MVRREEENQEEKIKRGRKMMLVWKRERGKRQK